MQTVLDDAETLFLHRIQYQDELRIIVAEGFRSNQAEDLVIGETNLGPAHFIELAANSRRFAVTFAGFVAWQVLNEGYTAQDDYEIGDLGFLQVFERSRYLDHVSKHHGWFRDVVGPATHYRLWTENEVVDVITFDAPEIHAWNQS